MEQAAKYGMCGVCGYEARVPANMPGHELIECIDTMVCQSCMRDFAAALPETPVVVEGATWSMPRLHDGDMKISIPGFGGENGHTAMRIGGKWFACWPGFSWREADENYR